LAFAILAIAEAPDEHIDVNRHCRGSALRPCEQGGNGQSLANTRANL
jgi:hypothetical protein